MLLGTCWESSEGDAMKTAKQLLIEGLEKMGADGLYSPIGECGRGIDDLEPCDCINLSSIQADI